MAYRANRSLGLASAKAFQLRLPAVLRKKVEDQAVIAGRSLNAELVRLVESALETGVPTSRKAQAGEGAVSYGKIDLERTLLDLFSKLAPEKRLALLTLLKP